jgi:nucleoid-associated protein YgaU
VPADKFYAAYKTALKNGEGWAKELQAFGKEELAKIERTARFSRPVPDECGTNGSSTMGATRDVGESHLAFCRAGGEPWAIALSEDRKVSAFQTAIEDFRRAPKNIENFAEGYREAVTTGDPKALALQQQATVEVQNLATSIQAATAYIPSEAVDVAVAAQVDEAAQAGKPWAAAAQADQAAQIPNDLLPITADSAPAFREAYRQGLADGTPWAVELHQFAGEQLAALDQKIDKFRATAKVTSNQVFDDMRTDALADARAAGEPWAWAAQADAAPGPRPEGATYKGTTAADGSTAAAGTTTAKATTAAAGAAPADEVSTAIPSEWKQPLPADQVEGFKAAFKEALKNDEPWARALITEGQQKVAALEEKYADMPEVEETERKGGMTPERRVAAQISRAERAGEPWAVAMKAEGELRIEQAEQKKIDQATNTKFLALPPEVGTGDPKDHNKVRNQDAADGSMKVPSPKEAFVGEYVRSNAIVQQLREGGLANVYNPLYQQHLAATVEAAGRGEAPPKGKGFLALTDHGFAYCYDPSKSPEHNAKIAELSLMSGMTFDQCHEARVGMVNHGDGKFEDALEVFKNFDPTKAGEVRIALDDSGKGKVEIVLKSDGNGGVTSEHSKQLSTWTKIGRAVGQYALPVAALVCAIVPGLQGVAAICISTASAIKSVVEGIKNKDWLGAVLGAVGAVGGVLQIAGKVAGGATSALAATGSKISDAAKALEGVRGVISGIQNKSLSATLMSVASVAGGLAGVVPKGTDIAGVLTTISKHAGQFGELATFGEAGLAALKNGDYLGAFVAAVKLGATAGQNYMGLDATVAQKIIQGAGVMQTVGTAVKNKDWTGAIAELIKGAKAVTGSDNKLLDAGATLAGVAQSLAHSDPMGAAKLAMEFVGKLTSEKDATAAKLNDPNTPAAEKTGLAATLEGLKKQLDYFGGFDKLASGIGAVVKAVKDKDPMAIVDAASGVVADLTKNGKISAAHDLIAAARKAYIAAKSGDQISAMQAALDLGKAIHSALESLNSDKKEPGTVPDPKAAIEGTLPPAEAAAAEGYRVKIGDTLPDIAKALLHDETRWPELYAYNRNALGDDPSQLNAGVKLELPPEGFCISSAEREAIIEAAKGKLPAAPPPAGTPVAPPDSYTARPGDSLSAIAKKLLGSASKWPELYEYNKDVIGENPNDLGIGDELKLPPADFTISDARRKEIIELAKGTTTGGTTGVGGTTPSGTAEVQTAQKQLNAWVQRFKPAGVAGPLKESGELDEATTAALKAFQSANGLTATGALDAATAKKLQGMEPPSAAQRSRAEALVAQSIPELKSLTTFFQGLLSPTGATAAAEGLREAERLQALLKDPGATASEIDKAVTKLQLWNRTAQDNRIGDLNVALDWAQISKGIIDQTVDAMSDVTGPLGKAIAAGYNEITGFIEGSMGPDGSLGKGLANALKAQGKAALGFIASDTLGPLLSKLGGKAGVEELLGEVARSAVSTVMEDLGKHVGAATTSYLQQLAQAKVDLKSGKLTQAQYNAKKSKLNEELATEVKRTLPVAISSLATTLTAAIGKKFGLEAGMAEKLATGLADGMRGPINEWLTNYMVKAQEGGKKTEGAL